MATAQTRSGITGTKEQETDGRASDGSVRPCDGNCAGALTAQLGSFRLERCDFLLELLHLARLIVLPPGAGKLLTQKLQLLLDDFEALFGFAVHCDFAFSRDRLLVWLSLT